MMKVTFAIAATVMAGFVLFYHVRMNRVRNSQGIIFDLMVLANGITAVSSLAEAYIKAYAGGNIHVPLYLCSFLYFATHSLIVPLLFLYVFTNVKTWREISNRQRISILFPLMVVLLLLFINPFNQGVFTYTEDGTYVRGSLLWILYVCTGIYIPGVFFVLIWYRKSFPHKKTRTILIGMAICISSVVLQGIYTDSNFETVAVAFTALYFFLSIQNPREQIDAEYPTYSRRAFADTLHYGMVARKRFDLVVLNIPDLRRVEVRRREDNKEVIKEIFDFLRGTAPGSDLFHLAEGRFAFVVIKPPQGFVDKMIAAVMKRFQEPWHCLNGEEMLPIKVLRLRIPDEISDEDVLYGVLSKFTVTGIAGSLMGINDFDLNEIDRNSKISAALVRAIDKNKLEMRYTPVWSLKNKRIVGVEAAVRFYDEDLGYVYDDEIFKYAERSGHVLRLSEMVFEDACSFFEDNLLAYRHFDMLAIRIYPSMRLQFGMLDKLMDIIKSHGIEPRTVKLLLSEYTVSVASETFKTEMKRLAGTGVKFCLEEYGSGYTDISSVYDLPVSLMKINQNVLRAAMVNEKARVTMESTLLLAHELYMATVVSGVEDEKYYNMISGMPCDYATGNYFFEQLDEEGFLRLLEDREEAVHK